MDKLIEQLPGIIIGLLPILPVIIVSLVNRMIKGNNVKDLTKLALGLGDQTQTTQMINKGLRDEVSKSVEEFKEIIRELRKENAEEFREYERIVNNSMQKTVDNIRHVFDEQYVIISNLKRELEELKERVENDVHTLQD